MSSYNKLFANIDAHHKRVLQLVALTEQESDQKQKINEFRKKAQEFKNAGYKGNTAFIQDYVKNIKKFKNQFEKIMQHASLTPMQRTVMNYNNKIGLTNEQIKKLIRNTTNMTNATRPGKKRLALSVLYKYGKLNNVPENINKFLNQVNARTSYNKNNSLRNRIEHISKLPLTKRSSAQKYEYARYAPILSWKPRNNANVKNFIEAMTPHGITQEELTTLKSKYNTRQQQIANKLAANLAAKKHAEERQKFYKKVKGGVIGVLLASAVAGGPRVYKHMTTPNMCKGLVLPQTYSASPTNASQYASCPAFVNWRSKANQYPTIKNKKPFALQTSEFIIRANGNEKEAKTLKNTVNKLNAEHRRLTGSNVNNSDTINSAQQKIQTLKTEKQQIITNLGKLGVSVSNNTNAQVNALKKQLRDEINRSYKQLAGKNTTPNKINVNNILKFKTDQKEYINKIKELAPDTPNNTLRNMSVNKLVSYKKQLDLIKKILAHGTQITNKNLTNKNITELTSIKSSLNTINGLATRKATGFFGGVNQNTKKSYMKNITLQKIKNLQSKSKSELNIQREM